MSSDHMATLTGGFDFEHAASYQSSTATIALRRTIFEVGARTGRWTDGEMDKQQLQLMPLLW